MGSREGQTITVSIIVITKDTRELLKGCLASVVNDTPLQSLGIETIIIDNASNDGTDSMVRQEFPDSIYIRNDVNAGFAAAVNRAGHVARGKYILLLNSDTILIEGEAAKMVGIADAIDNMGILGPQLVYEDLSIQRSVASIPRLKGELLPGSQRRRTNVASNDVSDVESLIGAAILIRKSAFDEIGGFDERFFFFLEETDFCLRLRTAGYRIVFCPAAHVIHLQGKTVRKNWVRGRIEYNISLRKFIRKHHASVYGLAFDSVKFIKALLFIVFLPFLLFGERSRMRYLYYCKLVDWYFSGCPDTFGLRNP
ncbi:MAG: glycosyltransferase family 2 protein [Syntrophorhabdaceae bacterium]|nr:glycosyltransferase [Syntrophorhabdaceae bacterium]MDD4196388.1 glycosyltransferase family 2 protein [Syntrophorhabdaceae bacterium]